MTSEKEHVFVFDPDQKAKIAKSPYVLEVIERASVYLRAGFPVHFSGPSGTGKTTLALALAASLERPIVLLHGNDEFVPSDLLGGNVGYRRRLLIDNFVHSVFKQDETMQASWVEGRLTTACRLGYTLVYDEFNRSRPESNNILLSILEEGILNMQGLHTDQQYLQVHPDFRAIFTSNPKEYAGVHQTPDALWERMITVNLGYFDRETELEIVFRRSGLDQQRVMQIVDLLCYIREAPDSSIKPTVRSSIRIAQLVQMLDLPVSGSNPKFRQICLDVLLSEASRSNGNVQEQALGFVAAALDVY